MSQLAQRQSMEPADAELVALAAAGDARAFTILHTRHAAGLYRHLVVLLGSPAEAEDTVQHVFIEAHKQLHRYRSDASFPGWLHGIAVRMALNARRAWRRRGSAIERLATEVRGHLPMTQSPEETASTAQQVAELHTLLAKENAKNRVPFLLYYVEQMDLAEIAVHVGATPAATWARIARTRATLLKSIERRRLGGVS